MLSCATAEALAQAPQDWWHGVLGVVCLGDDLGGPPDVPGVRLAMPRHAGSAVEVWRSAGASVSGRQGDIRYRASETALFGCLELDEGMFASVAAGRSPLQAVAEHAYRQVFALLEESGFPALFRVWNYFPGINEERDGCERYWQFNAGRQDAFRAAGRDVAGSVPAACALGTAEGLFVLYFIALRTAPKPIENPRQVSAYHYPSQYGPRSPTFARASLAELGGAPVLFVSGTASIVGHATCHAGDAAAQTVESLRNIEAVLAEAHRTSPEARFALNDLAYRIYVRHPGELETVRAAFSRYVPLASSVQVVLADVCRSDLLVEIEAYGGPFMQASA